MAITCTNGYQPKFIPGSGGGIDVCLDAAGYTPEENARKVVAMQTNCKSELPQIAALGAAAFVLPGWWKALPIAGIVLGSVWRGPFGGSGGCLQLAQNKLGMGAYPTDPYFDPQRPSWLPYWLDTFGEEAQKLGMYPGADVNQKYPNPPMPAPPPVPVDLPGNPTSGAQAQAAVDAVVAATIAQQQKQRDDFMAQVDAMLTQAEADRQRAGEQAYSMWVIAGAVGLGLLLINKLGRN